ncbi:hypothetical protein [Acidaminococcus provencensis]|uniref:hypothetical protein n=1 Tax=Acidaminococcus provencensis TaxID=2058289 RepID=UPI0022E234A5|nr:hypothetical protein [Acidaminococcus provencensis]
MSVLKSILHHWNSTSKAYDTLHPETEVGQITDFGKGLLNQLAATTAQSVISALQTGSWFGQLLKLVLNASGVTYSIDTNGYVCLGSFFGGLIIQWGISYESQTLTLPIQSKILVIIGMHEGTAKQTVSYSHSENKWVGSDSSLYLFYIAICK